LLSTSTERRPAAMFFRLLAQVVTRRGWVVVASWVALAVGLALVAPNWRTISRDDDVRFYPPGYPTVVGQTLLERGFPLDVASSSFVVVAERRGGALTVEDLEHLDGISDALAALRLKEPELEIKTVTDRNTPIIGPRMVGTNDGGQAALVNVALKTTYISKRTRITIDRLERFLEEEVSPAPAGLNLAWTGSAAVGHDMNEASNHSIETTTWTTVFLVVAILLVVYRSPLLAMIPLVTIAFSVFVSLRLIAAMTLVPGLDFQVINITPVFVTVILFGAGTDYCLFLIARYREELARGRDRTEAIREAIRTVGGALIASAGTVIVGLGMLYFSSFAKIQYTGPSIALSLAIALLAALTLGPVFLNALRGAVFWPFKPPHHERGRDAEQEGLEQAPALGAWTTVADHVVKRPGLILGASLVALAPLAYVGALSKPGYSQIADLEASAPSRAGTRIVERYFAAGELGPVGILIDHPGMDFRSDAGVAAVEAFASRLATAPNVAEVRAV
jgi:RND superfamily putative drug exporter